MTKFNKIILILMVVLVCAGCDQSTKYIASTNLVKGEVISFVSDIFRLQYLENKGAFLGIGDSLTETQRFVVFSVLVSVILGFLFLYILLNNNLKEPLINLDCEMETRKI